MAISNALMGATLARALKNQIALDLDSETALKCALFTSSLTPDPDAANPYFNASPYTANEVSGTGYTAGGVVLTGTSLGAASGILTFDAADASWSSSTITNAAGAIVYDNSLTNKDVLAAISFGGNYSTSNGTFLITWNAAGLWYVDYIP